MDWSQQTILITGGTGSFGKAFLRTMLADYHPNKLIVYSRDELKQHDMRQSGLNHPSLRFFIGDVRDRDRLKRALEGVDIVIHAAALKQVPACEYNPMEAIKTNILGSGNVVDAALDAGVRQVLALSTDKAVNPVNLYGATKLAAEKLVIQSNVYAANKITQMSCVRYGNVVGSRGSVVPVFLQQRASGEVTITDERMTRFWLTLEQGVRFVIRCVEQMHGGEVFIPKIPSMGIMDLAKAVAPRNKVRIIGIRPGEKLHEVLISEDEARSTVELPDMFVVSPAEDVWTKPFGHEWIRQGNSLPEGFRYASNTNPQWLTVEQIRAMIQPFEQEYARGKLS